MSLLKALAVIGAIAVFLGLNLEAQRKQEPPSIDFGGALRANISETVLVLLINEQ